jgi:hypothetical protein
MAIITRFRIEDEAGRIMTVHGEFSYDEDYQDAFAADFRTEEEAEECAIELVGSMRLLTVERFQRWSQHPDIDVSVPAQERAAA